MFSVIHWLLRRFPETPMKKGQRAEMLAKLLTHDLEARGIALVPCRPDIPTEQILTGIFCRWGMPHRTWQYRLEEPEERRRTLATGKIQVS